MRLLEAIIDANHRALAGDATGGVRPHEHADSLPLVVLTCFDPRMHPLMPEVLGIAESDFLWLTNAGNIVTGPLSSTVRSLALACAVQDGKEIAIIGHTDCVFCQPAKLVADRHWQGWKAALGAAAMTLDQFLDRFMDERQNVRHAARLVRESPLIKNDVPVHGLLVDVETGQLEWLVNGYETQTLTMDHLTVPPVLGTETPAPFSPQPARGEKGGFKIGGDLPPIGMS